MKKILAVVLSATMILSLAACAKTEAPAETEAVETVAETVAETEAETEPEKSFEELFAEALFGLDENDFDKTEFTSSMDGVNVIDSYTRKDGLMSIATYTYDNSEGITLEEYMLKVKKKYPGCVDIKEFEGTEFAVHSTMMGDGDEGICFTNFVVASGDKFITKSYVYPTYAFRFGESDTIVSIPKIMTEAADDGQEDIYGDVYLGGFLGVDEGLADIYFYESDLNDISYEAEKEGWEAWGFKMVDEEQFNAWEKDGFTLDEIVEYYKAVLGDSMTACDSYKVAGMPGNIFEYGCEYDGEPYTCISLIWIDGDKAREVYLEGPTERWPCIGDAIANGIYKSFEFSVDNCIKADPDRYELVDYESSSEGAEVIGYYADKKGIMDVYDKRIPVGEYGTIEGYMADKSADYKACTSMIDYLGNNMGLYTYFKEKDGEPLIKKRCVLLDDDYLFVRTYIYHTYETQFGDTDWYLYMPKVMEEVSSKEAKEKYGATDAFESTSKYMPLVAFYEFDEDDITYEKEKASWESIGVDMIDEDEFNTIFADGITLEAVDKYYGAILGDTVIEHICPTINGIDFSIYQNEFEIDGVKYSSAFGNWVEDGEIKELYIFSEADLWANTGLALINSMHKKN